MFDDSSGVDCNAPRAARMRPRTLDEIVGQVQLVGPDAPLRRAIEADAPPSCILWGPPGSGKTSIAQVIARLTDARFATISAVSSGVAELRRVIAAATAARRDRHVRTTLFIDEIHRFNKGQQDAVLPAVEDGTITLIGATTENPSFEVVAPLLSRARVFKLEPLSDEDIKILLPRAIADAERGLEPEKPPVKKNAIDALATYGSGDARVASMHWRPPPATLGPAGARSRSKRLPRSSRKRFPPTGAVTPTLTQSRLSSSRFAAPIPMPPSTGWRGCSRPARTRCSSPGGS